MDHMESFKYRDTATFFIGDLGSIYRGIDVFELRLRDSDQVHFTLLVSTTCNRLIAIRTLLAWCDLLPSFIDSFARRSLVDRRRLERSVKTFGKGVRIPLMSQ